MLSAVFVTLHYFVQIKLYFLCIVIYFGMRYNFIILGQGIRFKCFFL